MSTEFENLVTRYARLMSSAARRVCAQKHLELVPDIEQEVRLALWKRLQSGKKIDHPASYIYKVALTTAWRLIRRAGPDPVPLDETTLPSPEVSVASGLTPTERARFIEQALLTLGPDESRAVRAHLAGFNHREIATLFGWSESVARHRVYRSMESLASTFAAGKGKGEETP